MIHGLCYKNFKEWYLIEFHRFQKKVDSKTGYLFTLVSKYLSIPTPIHFELLRGDGLGENDILNFFNLFVDSDLIAYS